MMHILIYYLFTIFKIHFSIKKSNMDPVLHTTSHNTPSDSDPESASKSTSKSEAEVFLDSLSEDEIKELKRVVNLEDSFEKSINIFINQSKILVDIRERMIKQKEICIIVLQRFNQIRPYLKFDFTKVKNISRRLQYKNLDLGLIRTIDSLIENFEKDLEKLQDFITSFSISSEKEHQKCFLKAESNIINLLRRLYANVDKFINTFYLCDLNSSEKLHPTSTWKKM